MKFTKMHGIGNDYVYVSTFDQKAPADPAALAVTVSDRHFGVGSDGLILIGPSERADARMRMFNADGSESEMCGNGVRCVAKYVYDHGIARKPRVRIETGRGVLTLDIEAEGETARRVQVDMGAPILQGSDIPTTLPGDPPIEVPIAVDGHDPEGHGRLDGQPARGRLRRRRRQLPRRGRRRGARAPSGVPAAGERPLRPGDRAGRGPDADLGARQRDHPGLRDRGLRRLRGGRPDGQDGAGRSSPTSPAATSPSTGRPTTAPSS